MSKGKAIPWHRQRRGQRLSTEPGATMFRGLRTRLTLWYSGVLGSALLLFSVVLYLGVQQMLFTSIRTDLAGRARRLSVQWQRSPDFICSSFNFGPVLVPPMEPHHDVQREFPTPFIAACFDQNGNLLQNSETAQLPQAFLTNDLAKTALQTGRATDIVDGGGTVGDIYRYALMVPDLTRSGRMGVIQVGMSILPEETALHFLLLLLLIIGGVILLGAGMGGLFLANRALAPTRLAFTRQQRFIADASHELRTPLTLLRADAEVLLRGRDHLPADDVALLEDIVAEANHMATLAINMLALARLDSGNQHREHDVINLAEVASAVVHRTQALASQMDVTVDVEHTDAVLVVGDAMLLEQAGLVLLDNAIKYNRRGGRVTVRTFVLRGQACWEIRDTGTGIAAEHLPHLGERFYRVDKARSREGGGTGLGLSIARGIAVVHGGTMTLTSIPNQGTTATLTIPLGRSPIHGGTP